MSNPTQVFAAEGLCKSFGGTQVLSDVSVTIAAGEVLAVVGQNGSGKSTLVKIMSGYHEPDAGQIVVGDRGEFRFVHQNLGLIPTISIVDNFALERGYGTASSGLSKISWRQERRRAREMLVAVGLKLDPELLVSELSMGERALVAVARALGAWDGETKLLILDEPTVSLSEADTERLFAAVHQLCEQGIGVLCVLHSVHEVLAHTDRVLVLRDGHAVADSPVADLTHDMLLELIVGQPLEEYVPPAPEPGAETLLTADRLEGLNVVDVSLQLRVGEILGVAGLVGSGREELLSLIQGVSPRLAGTVALEGRSLEGGAEAAISQGVVMVPANRERDGCVASLTVQENIMLPSLHTYTKHGVLRPSEERKETVRWINRLEVKPPRPDALLSGLSGGNQQKVVFAKWLRMSPRVLLLEESTQGVDVRAKRIMYEALVTAARGGAGVILSSSDHEELARICDKVVVLQEGRVGAVLSGAELTEDRISIACHRVGSAATTDALKTAGEHGTSERIGMS